MIHLSNWFYTPPPQFVQMMQLDLRQMAGIIGLLNQAATLAVPQQLIIPGSPSDQERKAAANERVNAAVNMAVEFMAKKEAQFAGNAQDKSVGSRGNSAEVTNRLDN